MSVDLVSKKATAKADALQAVIENTKPSVPEGSGNSTARIF